MCRWQRSWGVTHRCSQLQSLNRLAVQNPEAMLNLQGKKKQKTVIGAMISSFHVISICLLEQRPALPRLKFLWSITNEHMLLNVKLCHGAVVSLLFRFMDVTLQ